MEKKEFTLTEKDFNRAMLIANIKPKVAQLVAGKFVFVTKQELADAFWNEIAARYSFVRETLEVNLPNRDGRFFLATEISKCKYGCINNECKNIDDTECYNQVEERKNMTAYCALCDHLTGPTVDSGCDRSKEFGCAWHSPLR